VGGHRKERMRWAQHMAKVDAVLFVVALSHFDVPVVEDKRVVYILKKIQTYSCKNRKLSIK
jgi:hypothetical protein